MVIIVINIIEFHAIYCGYFFLSYTHAVMLTELEGLEFEHHENFNIKFQRTAYHHELAQCVTQL
jgi:hypothetical protein